MYEFCRIIGSIVTGSVFVTWDPQKKGIFCFLYTADVTQKIFYIFLTILVGWRVLLILIIVLNH
jgi:hypothetical protein